MSYVAFMREKVGIRDQKSLSELIGQLATHVTPLTLGMVNRQYSHIRLVARKLLNLRKDKMPWFRSNRVIRTLIEKMYSHGHAIGRQEAAHLGLPVKNATAEQESAIWTLYRDYEDWLRPGETIDPEATLTAAGAEEITQTDLPFAVIESEKRLDVFEMNLVHRRKRQVPPNPQINVNVNLALPPGLAPGAVPPNWQQILQQLVNQVSQAVPGLVHSEIVRQSPVAGFELRGFGGKWVKRS